MRKHFLTGLVILLPVAVTIAVILFLVNFFTEPFIGIASELIHKWNLFPNGFLFVKQESIIQYGSRIIILILLFSCTVILGIFTRWFFINGLFKLCDKVLHRIPIINTVYKTSQDIIKTLFVSDKNSFKQVVMVPFPRPGVYAIGLIARESPLICSQTAKESLTSVLIPTTPNPTTGFLLMFKKEELIPVDMKPEEAIKYIVSCGVILPGEKIPQTGISP
jgi:uncharacterized membrane protein